MAKKSAKSAKKKIKKKGVAKIAVRKKSEGVVKSKVKKAKVEVQVPAEATIALKKTKEGAKTRVLSIDDEEVIRTLLKKMLTKAGYDVAVAASGEDALKAMQKQAFDLCIIDLKMPGMGGMEFLSQMKQFYPDTEALILTAFGDIDIAVDAMRKGAFNFLSKPFKRDTLLAIIERALERKAMKQDLEETRAAMWEMESEASRRIGEFEGQLVAVEEAKRELGDSFNDIKKSLIEGTGDRSNLEKSVVALEMVAGQIKRMEEKIFDSENNKKIALKKAISLEKDLRRKVSGNVQLGNKLKEAKASLEDLKKEVAKEKNMSSSDEKTDVVSSLTDIHKALAEFRKETEKK